MAIIQAPFLSLGAKGQVAKTLVASTWKGVKTMRHYVKPANPRSTAQTTQRKLFADVVAYWHAVSTDEETTTAWNRLALVSGKPQSGFNAFSSAQVRLGKLTGKLLAGSKLNVENGIEFEVEEKTVSGGGTETATYSAYVGSTPDKLYKTNAGVTYSGGILSAGTLALDSGSYFFKIVANVPSLDSPLDITGIYPLVLV